MCLGLEARVRRVFHKPTHYPNATIRGLVSPTPHPRGAVGNPFSFPLEKDIVSPAIFLGVTCCVCWVGEFRAAQKAARDVTVSRPRPMGSGEAATRFLPRRSVEASCSGARRRTHVRHALDPRLGSASGGYLSIPLLGDKKILVCVSAVIIAVLGLFLS